MRRGRLVTSAGEAIQRRHCVAWAAIGGLLSLVVAAGSAATPTKSTVPNRPIVLVSDWPTNLREGQVYVISADRRHVRAVNNRLRFGGAGSLSWSPDGGRLAYSTNADPLESAVIYTVDADGGALRTVAEEWQNGGDPRWSPDGTRIAFTSYGTRYDPRPPEIWVIDADGSNGQRLVEGAADPSWSPDSQSLVFDGGQLALMNSDGSGQRAIISPSGTPLTGSRPAWSPDGTRLAYVAREGHVHLVSPDGTADVDLTPAGVDDSSPAWSPDSRRLAVVRKSKTGGRPRIITIARDGSDPRTIRTLPRRALGVDLAWSSRNEIAFVAKLVPSVYRVQLLDPRGGKPRPLPVRVRETEPAWSPDGRRLAVVRDVREHGTDIYLRSASGRRARRLTRLSGSESEPAWSADGTRIAFAYRYSSSSGIYVVGVSGRGLRRVVKENADLGQPTWAPDGRSIAFIRGGPYSGYINTVRLRDRRVRPIARGQNPDWAPRGRKLAFDRNGSVHTLTLGQGRMRRLTSGFDPAWSPDGRSLVLVDWRGGDRDLFLVGADGRHRRLLTDDFADEFMPDW
jgi:Tol biopolymer transport system component